MGRFELRDGREAAVVIVGSHADKALILEDRGGRVAVVAVPGVERVYQAIQRLLEGCAGGSAHP
ncbi:MAG: hypothetical protein GXO15_01480 [Crenarchaeota archaeon]|nr:hypothetical protein [Thermoproteota archaeon]